MKILNRPNLRIVVVVTALLLAVTTACSGGVTDSGTQRRAGASDEPSPTVSSTASPAAPTTSASSSSPGATTSEPANPTELGTAAPPVTVPGAPFPVQEVVVVKNVQDITRRVQVLRNPDTESAEDFMVAERAKPETVSAELNVTAQLLSSGPNDTAYKKTLTKASVQQPYMSAIGACCTKATSDAPGPNLNSFLDSWDPVFVPLKPDPAPIVALLDTGMAPLNPELVGALTNGYDAVNQELIPAAQSFDAATDIEKRHGTMVASVIAATRNNGKSIAGLATNSAPVDGEYRASVKIMPIVVAGKASQPKVDLAAVARGLYYASVTLPNRSVVLMPFGFFDDGVMPAWRTLWPAINELQSKGIVIVAAARDTKISETDGVEVSVPASLPDVIAVGGWAANGLGPAPANSPKGDRVDLVAPAERIAVDYKDPSFWRSGWRVEGGVQNGQSFAAAMVAATAAMRIGGAQGPCAKGDVRECLSLDRAAIVVGARSIGVLNADLSVTRPNAEFQGAGMLSVPATVGMNRAAAESTAVRPPTVAIVTADDPGGRKLVITPTWASSRPANSKSSYFVYINVKDGFRNVTAFKKYLVLKNNAPAPPIEILLRKDTGVLNIKVSAFYPALGQGLASDQKTCTVSAADKGDKPC